MRKAGVKLTAEEMKATGQVVRVTFKRHPLGQPTHWAKTFDVISEKEIGFLECAHIRLIDDGIKISGFDNQFPPLWWCVPLTTEQNDELKASLDR